MGRNRDKLTVTQATACAREFVRGVTDPERQWSVNTVAGYLPPGWDLPEWISDDPFHPVTVGNIAKTMRHYARRIVAEHG